MNHNLIVQKLHHLDDLFKTASSTNHETDWIIYLNARDEFERDNLGGRTNYKPDVPNSLGVTMIEALYGDPAKASVETARRWQKSVYSIQTPRKQLIARYIELTDKISRGLK